MTAPQDFLPTPEADASFREIISTERKIQAGFAVALLVLGIIGVWSYLSILRLEGDANAAHLTEHRVSVMQNLLLATIDAETGQRGFVLTGDPSYLEPYRAGLSSIAKNLKELGPVEGVEQLGKLIARRLESLERGIALRQSEGLESAQVAVSAGAGKKLQDEIRERLAKMERDEREALGQREERTQRGIRWTRRAIIAGSLLAVGVALTALHFIRRDFRERLEAEKALKRLNEELDARVRERTAKLTEAHESLSKNERLLRTVTKDARVGLAMISSGHRYLFANLSYGEMLGLGDQDLVGRHVGDVLSDVYEGQMRDRLEECLLGERGHFELHCSVRGEAGRYYVVTLEPQKDSEDGDAHVIEVICEITEQREAEEELKNYITERSRTVHELQQSQENLRQERALLRGLIDSIPDLIFFKNTESVFLGCNRAFQKYFRVSEKDLIGSSDLDLVGADVASQYKKMDREVIETRQPKHVEEWIPAGEGEGAYFDTVKNPYFGEDGDLLGIIGVSRNITERRRTEEEVRRLNADLERRVAERTSQLEMANKELEAFSYSVSHDLRSPLRTLDGFSQAVMEDYGDLLPEEGGRYLQTIREGAQRMGTLIDDLLTFSRLSRAPLSRRPINTSELVKSVLEDLRVDGKPHVQVNLGHLPDCDGDPALLRQVWMNLLSNALKYSGRREKAVITIGTSKDNGEVEFFVRDNGAGFDMRYADKLFGVFQRLHRAEDYEGTGVGLAIVQRVIHRHGGRIWGEGKPDHGATFYFTIPPSATV